MVCRQREDKAFWRLCEELYAHDDKSRSAYTSQVFTMKIVDPRVYGYDLASELKMHNTSVMPCVYNYHLEQKDATRF